MRAVRGFGVAGALPGHVIGEIARAAEQAGFVTFWVNDTPAGDGLAALATAAAVTSQIRLGVGVIALDRHSPERILDRIAELGLPSERLILGIGSGRPSGGLQRVRTAVGVLRGRTPAKVIVGALGPKMSELAGAEADGVLLNWVTPRFAAASAELVRSASRAAGRDEPFIAGYVRTALGAPSTERLHQEADRYASFPAYAANFSRIGVEPMETAVTGDDAADLRPQLAAYEQALDETVVRAITAEETTPAYQSLIQATAPQG